MKKIRLFFISILFSSQLFSQYQLDLTRQFFNYSSPKYNINNRWSWIKLGASKQITPKYIAGIEILGNTSYLFMPKKNGNFFNQIPRGKNILENIGLGIKNEFILKSHSDILVWSLVNSTSVFNTPIYSTKLYLQDSGHYYANEYSDKQLIFTSALSLQLKAKINTEMMLKLQFGALYLHHKNVNIVRSFFEFGLNYSLVKHT